MAPHAFFVRAGSLVALIIMAVFAGREKQEGGLSPILKGYLLYFAANVIGFWFLPGSLSHILRSVPAAFLYAAFLIAGMGPALFGGPYFTEYFARKSTPPPVWETDIFKKIMRNMSWMWAALFAASLVVALIPELMSLKRGLWTALVFQIFVPGLLMLGVGVTLNKKYPAYYQRKMGIEPYDDTTNSSDDHSAVSVSELKKEETMSNRLRVVAINGSPHVGHGNTSMMIQMLTPGLAAEGIDLEEIFLAEKRIEYCIGCAVCMEKGKCWRPDDHGEIIQKLLDADGVILASPTYFGNVTAQMKTFVDRSLAYGHKPRTTWKPGLAISVSAGKSEIATADYLAGWLRAYGAFSVGILTAIAVGPAEFLGKEIIETRAADLARDLSRAIKEKRRYPATENDLSYYFFMGELVKRGKEIMADDYKYWKESGFYEGFEAFVGQTFSAPPYNPDARKEWLKELISTETVKAKGMAGEKKKEPAPGKPDFKTCRDLLEAMPLGFKKEAAGDLKAVYQFEIDGTEKFTAHLNISDGTCVYAEGAHPKPDVTIKSPADVWLAISKGEMNGQAAFMSGKYKVEGDMGLLLKLGKMFG